MKAVMKGVLRLYGVITGLIFGVVIGLLVFGTLFRVFLDFLFGYGDSGPSWITVVIVICTVLITIICIWISNRWVSSYIKKHPSN
jgi:uncharacterized protein YneF (UPF0154 family)